VRGYKEEGTTTTPFDMTVLNDLDRFPSGRRRDRPRERFDHARSSRWPSPNRPNSRPRTTGSAGGDPTVDRVVGTMCRKSRSSTPDFTPR
jgi:hypothetical protein